MARTETSKTSVTVRLFREGGGRRDLVYEVSLERMLAEPDLYPPLQDGDVHSHYSGSHAWPTAYARCQGYCRDATR